MLSESPECSASGNASRRPDLVGGKLPARPRTLARLVCPRNAATAVDPGKYRGVCRLLASSTRFLAHAAELPYALAHGIDRATSDAARGRCERDLHPDGRGIGAS